MKTYQNYINGKWLDSLSNDKIEVEDPATTNIIGEIACAKSTEVDLAVEAAKKSFESRILIDMPILERAKLMRKIADETRKIAKEGGTILCYENGKSIQAAIKEFNDEMTSAFNQLKSKEDERQKMYDMIKDGTIAKDKNDKAVEDPSDLSDWEIKINEIESQK